MQICGMFLKHGPSFLASERTVYKEFQISTLSDKEQEGIGENAW